MYRTWFFSLSVSALIALCSVFIPTGSSVVPKDSEPEKGVVLRPAALIAPTFRGTSFEGYSVGPSFAGPRNQGNAKNAAGKVLITLFENQGISLIGPAQDVPYGYAVYIEFHVTSDMSVASVAVGGLEVLINRYNEIVAPGNVAYAFENTTKRFTDLKQQGDVMRVVVFPKPGKFVPFFQAVYEDDNDPVEGSGNITLDSVEVKVVSAIWLRTAILGQLPPPVLPTPVPDQPTPTPPPVYQPTPTPYVPPVQPSPTPQQVNTPQPPSDNYLAAEGYTLVVKNYLNLVGDPSEGGSPVLVNQDWEVALTGGKVAGNLLYDFSGQPHGTYYVLPGLQEGSEAVPDINWVIMERMTAVDRGKWSVNGSKKFIIVNVTATGIRLGP